MCIAYWRVYGKVASGNGLAAEDHSSFIVHRSSFGLPLVDGLGVLLEIFGRQLLHIGQERPFFHIFKKGPAAANAAKARVGGKAV